MPELPEVEYVARQLRATLPGHRFTGADVRWPRTTDGMEPAVFAAALTGRTVTEIGLRAKYLLVTLDDGAILVIHRRMSGNLALRRVEEPEPPYVRVALDLDDGRRLYYTDPRKFGRLTLVSPGAPPAKFAELGPEPLDDSFTASSLAARLMGSRRALKAVLLDQWVVAGLGNIYADEALYRARLHPLRQAGSLTTEEVARLHAGIKGALTTGIAHGGTTFGRHLDLYEEAGSNLEHVDVYRKTGQPCSRCGTPIARITIAQRSAHFCPTCQRA